MRLQHLQQGLLDQSIQHCGDAQLALAPIRFGDHHLAYRTGPVASYQQVLADVRPTGLHMQAVCSMSSPSTPAAPLLALTRLHATCRFCLVSAISSRPAGPATNFADPVPRCARSGPQASSLTGSHPASPRATPARIATASDAWPLTSPRPRSLTLVWLFAITFRPHRPRLQLLRPLLTSRSGMAVALSGARQDLPG